MTILGLSMVCHMVKDKNWKILIKSGEESNGLWDYEVR